MINYYLIYISNKSIKSLFDLGTAFGRMESKNAPIHEVPGSNPHPMFPSPPPPTPNSPFTQKFLFVLFWFSFLLIYLLFIVVSLDFLLYYSIYLDLLVDLFLSLPMLFNYHFIIFLINQIVNRIKS